MFSCEDCKKRDSCVEECEWLKDELSKVDHKRSGWESLVSDMVRNDETLLSEDDEYSHRDPIANYSTDNTIDWPVVPLPSKQKDRTEIQSKLLRWMIICLRKDGLSTREIAYHLPCSQPFIVRVITDHKNKHAEITRKNET